MAFGDFECRIGPWLPVGGVVVAERWPCDDSPLSWGGVTDVNWPLLDDGMSVIILQPGQLMWASVCRVSHLWNLNRLWFSIPPPPNRLPPRHFPPPPPPPQTILKERLCSTLGWAVYSIHEPYIVLLPCVLFDWPPRAELLFAQHHWHFQVGFDGGVTTLTTNLIKYACISSLSEWSRWSRQFSWKGGPFPETNYLGFTGSRGTCLECCGVVLAPLPARRTKEFALKRRCTSGDAGCRAGTFAEYVQGNLRSIMQSVH